VTAAIITASKLLEGLYDATRAVLVLGCCPLVYGLLTLAWHPLSGLPLQTVALIGFGAAAAFALVINPNLGAYLVAAGLIGHTAWDAHHPRTNRVVARSLAEFCMFLDTALAVIIIVVTMRG
jgi:hypothetical protein